MIAKMMEPISTKNSNVNSLYTFQLNNGVSRSFDGRFAVDGKRFKTAFLSRGKIPVPLNPATRLAFLDAVLISIVVY